MAGISLKSIETSSVVKSRYPLYIRPNSLFFDQFFEDVFTVWHTVEDSATANLAAEGASCDPVAAQVAAKRAVYETMVKMAPYFSTAWTLKTMLPLLAYIDNFKFEDAAPGAHHTACLPVQDRDGLLAIN